MYVNKMFEWVVPALVEAAAEETPSGLPEGWQTYVGRYRDRWGDCQVLIYEG